MSDPGLKPNLDHLGLNKEVPAPILRVGHGAARPRITARLSRPGEHEPYLCSAEAAQGDATWTSRCHRESPQEALKEGLYELRYRGEDAGVADGGIALAVLRNGKILGSGRDGGVFRGSFWLDPADNAYRIEVRLDVPAGEKLVTGFGGGPDGAAIEIRGAVERGARACAFEIDIAGRPLEVRFAYLGPPPS